MESFFITRTNTKRYVGRCGLCDYTTNVISVRANCAMRLRTHCITEHGVHPTSLNQYLEPDRKARTMKNPKKELPPLEKLSEYEGHLMVFGGVTVGKVTSQFGTSVADALVWVYIKDSTWKALGNTPIFWQTAGRQLLEEIGPDSETPDETMGGYLRKGGHPDQKGSNDFYWIEATSGSQDNAKLKQWSKEFADEF